MQKKCFYTYLIFPLQEFVPFNPKNLSLSIYGLLIKDSACLSHGTYISATSTVCKSHEVMLVKWSLGLDPKLVEVQQPVPTMSITAVHSCFHPVSLLLITTLWTLHLHCAMSWKNFSCVLKVSSGMGSVVRRRSHFSLMDGMAVVWACAVINSF